MSMRSPLCLFVLFAVTSPMNVSAAQLTSPVTLNSVTLFSQGADLQNSSQLSLPAGESDIVFTGIANVVDEQSINVRMDNNVTVLSSRLNDTLPKAEEMSPHSLLQSKLAELKHELRQLTAQQENIQPQLDVLAANQALNNKSTAETQKYLQLVKSKGVELLQERAELAEKIALKQKEIKTLKNQSNDNFSASRLGKQIIVKVFSPKAVSTQVSLTYISPNASWTPGYDIYSDGINQPIRLVYKAIISQTTGINWENVNLTLSSADPTRTLDVHLPEPVHLDFLATQPLPAESKRYSYAPPKKTLAQEKDSVEMSGSLAKASTDMQAHSSVNTRYAISLPWNIPSDNIPRTVTLKEAQIKGSYRYIAIPKISNEAFLQVNIDDWEDLNILPGNSQLFYEKNKTGNGYLKMPEDGEALKITLASDPRLIIQRKSMLKKENATGLFDDKVVRDFSYSLNVKNSHAQAVGLTIIDQIPISTNSDIIVEKMKYGEAQFNKQTGELRWDLQLSSGENRKIPFSYSVKYPQHMIFTGW